MCLNSCGSTILGTVDIIIKRAEKVLHTNATLGIDSNVCFSVKSVAEDAVRERAKQEGQGKAGKASLSQHVEGSLKVALNWPPVRHGCFCHSCVC